MANQVQANPTTQFFPSSEMLLAMVDRAMAKFDCARDQAARAEEARLDARAVRMWTAAAEQRRFRNLYGPAVFR